ncbi:MULTISPECIES: peptidoglycan DD-metalloendopeptidase family protein [unclassified Spirosoma]|uniref:peptidoglycan DD-metalloendopeptidase family protein n=1 Tax=unclassified Spirosoma TaxID=2621999 RepID=UPI0009607F56|nr:MULTISPECIES: peptidoglycan DD-metalloendopeptidase family protein [unclassified Spirosoma]MBN8824385.1 peptidoglycan DD-metalloendopeptidase family protein [Spirosoma sp.]OJW70151.1 MAG: peptidase M23 [Spirosoma sp. 48-14]
MRRTATQWLLAIGCLCITLTAQAQERGRFKNNLRITPKNGATPNAPVVEQPQKADDPFEQETTQLRFNNQFEPKKELNPVVSEDTSQIDQGETSVVEVIDSVLVGNEWVKIADYYAVWDSRTIDPYNIDPLEFDETIDIKLYDPPANRYWSAPLNEGKMTSNFGFRWGRWHTGTDLDLETGNPVYAAFDGIVRVVGWDGNGYGRYVLIRHYNGLETLYGHLSKQTVETGQLIKAGDQIGLGGSTGRSSGPHLHFETRYEGNPFSPLNIYAFPENTILSDHFLLTGSVWDYLRGGRSSSSESRAKPRFKRTVLHKVRSGDTLSSIADRYGLSVSALKRKNHISGSRLRAGQKIRVH